MIWLIGGTTEGRDSLTELLQHGYQVLLSVVSKTGVEVVEQWTQHANLLTRVGALSLGEMENLLKREPINLIVDASHPFAALVSANLRQVALQAGLPLIRVVRPEVELTDCLVAESLEQVVQQVLACTLPGERVFLAMGANGLQQLVPPLKQAGLQVVARLLPTMASLAKAEAAGLTAQEVIALQGHGSLALNLALLREYDCKALVTKESGTAGGLDIKAQVAQTLKIPLIVLQRPQEENQLYCTAKELVAFIEKKGWST